VLDDGSPEDQHVDPLNSTVRWQHSSAW
jgi:hypothetical protein